MRCIIKCGLTTHTTIGHLTGFESHAYYYSGLEKCNLIEAAVYTSHHNDSDPFSAKGDSGAIIVDALGKFVAFLTSGAGVTIPTDITFAAPL